MNSSFDLSDFNIRIEYINLPNSSSSCILKVYKQNMYASFFCSVIAKPIKEKAEFLNLHVSFAKCPSISKLGNEEILISRAIDKALRPSLGGLAYSISVNIALLQFQPWLDLKAMSIITALFGVRRLFNISTGVASVCIGSKTTYFGRYDKNNHNDYVIVCGNKNEINFLEIESKGLSNTTEVLQNLIIYAQQVNEALQSIPFQHEAVPDTLKVYNKRLAKRKNNEYRKFDVQMNVSNNSIILSRGDTMILSTFITNKNYTDFDHIYKSSGFATSELQNRSSRREIGHGNLVYRALYSTVFKHSVMKTCKIISYVLSANGSTSMASVMAASLNMLREGHILQHELLYGISFGALLQSNGQYQIIVDMTADEDNASAMDFKIVSDAFGKIYAVQMDAKVPVPVNIIFETLQQSKIIFESMAQNIIKLISNKQLQYNVRRIMNETNASVFRNNSLVANSLRTVMDHIFFDNKLYIHLQSNKINLQEFANFYLCELKDNTNVCFVITKHVNNETNAYNDLYDLKFTRKQQIPEGSIIRALHNNGKLTFIDLINKIK